VINGSLSNSQDFTMSGGTLQADPNPAIDCAGDNSDPTAGAAFILTGTSSSNVAILNIQPGATVILNGIDNTQATATGLPTETLFWQNRLATKGNADGFSGTTTLSGLLYFPTGNVTLGGGATASNSCLEVIAWQLTIAGNPTLSANGCLFGTKPIPPPAILAE
jgi:hypothetical protein